MDSQRAGENAPSLPLNGGTGIVIPSDGRNLHVLIATVRSLNHACYGISAPIRAVIVLNGRRDLHQVDIPFARELASLQSHLFFPIRLESLPPSEEGGAARARNHGAHTLCEWFARDQIPLTWLWFVDDDFWLPPGSLRVLLRYAVRLYPAVINMNWEWHPVLLMRLQNSCFLRWILENQWHTRTGRSGGFSRLTREGCVQEPGTGGAYLLPWNLFERSGGFPENIPFSGDEDRIFAQNLQKIPGFRGFFTPLCPVAWHTEFHAHSLESWLARWKRNARTIRFRHDLYSSGRDSHASIPFSRIQRILYILLMPIRRVFLSIARILNQYPILCPLFRKVWGLLMGLAFLRGWTRAYVPAENWDRL